VGRSSLSWLALSVNLGAAAVRSALLERTKVAIFADSLSGALAYFTHLGQYSNH